MFADLDTVNGTSQAITAKIGGSSVSAQIIPYTVKKGCDFPGKIANLFLQCTYLHVHCNVHICCMLYTTFISPHPKVPMTF
jgi:hypothetical protein